MAQRRCPVKEIIQLKLQEQCDENKDTNTDGNSIKNLSKQESHEQADTVLALGKRGAGGGVCVCVCVSAVSKPRTGQATACNSIGPMSNRRGFSQFCQGGDTAGGDAGPQVAALSDRWAQPTRANLNTHTHTERPDRQTPPQHNQHTVMLAGLIGNKGGGKRQNTDQGGDI